MTQEEEWQVGSYNLRFVRDSWGREQLKPPTPTVVVLLLLLQSSGVLKTIIRRETETSC